MRMRIDPATKPVAGAAREVRPVVLCMGGQIQAVAAAF
jgi:hypothetical protein